MSRLTIAIAMVLVATSAAADSRSATTRVVLADTDPELRRALIAALSPWRADVIVQADVSDDAGAAVRAATDGAQFVVWRDGDGLVVFDRTRGLSERRLARAGILDAVGAAAAALTVKTMMRLPPPEPEEMVVVEPAAPVIGETAARELRIELGGSSRIAFGDTAELGARVLGAVMIRPTRLALRFGVGGELGTSTAVDNAGFKGTWSDWGILALTSWSHPIGVWEIEPYLGLGVAHSALSGTESSMTRDESATLFAIAGGAWIRRGFGAWSIAGGLRFQATPGTPAYTKMTMGGGSPTIFQVPVISGSLGIVIAADVGL